jgi:hypothetical protein
MEQIGNGHSSKGSRRKINFYGCTTSQQEEKDVLRVQSIVRNEDLVYLQAKGGSRGRPSFEFEIGRDQ